MFFVNVPVYVAVLILSCTIAAYFFWIIYQKKLKTGGTRVQRRAGPSGANPRRRGANLAVQRRIASRMRRDSDSEVSDAEDIPLPNRLNRRAHIRNADTNEDSDIRPEVDEGKSPQKKIGTKKAAKLAEKERRKEEREAEERLREHQRKLEDMEIEKRKKAEQAEEQAAAAAAAAEAKRLEEEAAREQAEYERLKQEFSIEEEGADAPQRDSKAEEKLNLDLISAIHDAKIIPVEHLACDFNLKTEVCVEKLKALMSSGRLTGVLDDRGKFIHITEDEYERVARFIENRGRVTLAELVDNGHKLIRTSTTSRS